MTRLWFQTFLLPDGWAKRVRIDIAEGRIQFIQPGVPPDHGAECHAIGLPGIPNVHSHAFQRGLARLTEVRGTTGDSFWTWRETMYRFVDTVGREDIEALAAFAYMEMLEAGFTRVGEFHYLHHDRGGRRFSDPAEMASGIAAAAEQVGIGLTLLPVFYAHSGFGGAAADQRQSRLVNDIDGFARLLDHSRRAVSSLDDAVIGVAPHSLRAVTPDELTSVVGLAEGGPVHIHIAEQWKEVDDCLSWCGRRPVTWLMDTVGVDELWCLIHATHVDERELERIAASGATVGLCPITESNLGDGIFPAARFAALHGSFGIGSDSNVLIDAAQELRVLEYTQRLTYRARNVMAKGDGRSTGRALFEWALAGGSRALGIPTRGIRVGAAADFISLDPNHDALTCREGDAHLDSWIFAARLPAVDCVWRYGSKVVSGGQHRQREAIASRFQASIKRLLII
jgi:formimidoylglutamate deiminase